MKKRQRKLSRVILNDTPNDSLTCRLVILSGTELFRDDLGAFVLDLSSMQFHRDRYIVDYDHLETQVLGWLGDVEVTEEGLIGTAHLSSTNGNDRASEVIQRIKDGTPYEVSPTIDLPDPEEVPEGVTVEVNGQTVEGPIDIYRNVEFRGVGICPYGTDKFTKIISLKRSNEVNMSKKTKKLSDDVIKEDELIETAAEIVEDATDGEVPAEAAYPLLEEMIEEFGFEEGVNYFRRGLSFEEAEQEDYENLKALRARLKEGDEEDGAIEDVVETDGSEGDTDGTDDEEEKKIVAGLKAEICKLSKALTSLRASIRVGEDTPLSASVQKAVPDNRPAVLKMADKIKRNGINTKQA